jgi:hypothetical protein
MKGLRWFLFVSVVLVLVACQSGGKDSQGLIVYQSVDASGKPQPELVVIDPDGQERHRISFAEPVVRYFSTLAGQRVVVQTFDGKQHLLDAEKGTTLTLDLPEGASVRQDIRGSGKRWLLAVETSQGGQLFLVNLETGGVTPLTALPDEIESIYYGEFSRDEKHLTLWLAGSSVNEFWLIPTASPAQARRLGGDAQVQWGSFSDDGKRVVYLERAEAKENDVVVENVDGSEREVVVAGASAVRAYFAPGQEQLILVDRNKLYRRALKDGREQELLTFSGIPSWFGFAPSGKKLVFSVHAGDSDEIEWYLVDLSGSAQRLDSLVGFMPNYLLPGHRWILFSQGIGPLKGGGRFAVLDLESGAVREMLILDDTTRFSLDLSLSSDGKLALIVTNPANKGNQLWLLNGDSGETRLLAEANVVNGSFSPDGKWVAVSTLERSGETGQARMVRMSVEGDESKELGEGLRPIWARP